MLALATNLRGHMDEVHEVYDETLRQLGMQELIEPLRAHVRRRTTVVEICGWMERAGFAVRKEVQVDQYLPESSRSKGSRRPRRTSSHFDCTI